MTDAWNAVITEVEPPAALPGPLHGKRLLVKDLFDTAGIRTTYGSKIYADHVPTRTAPAVQRLVDAGFPLKTIGDYVGHRSASSTEIYTKVAIETLRNVALGDGEALP